jgi:MoaA/NifB/PqqE/SkfB family radical SAM enzyme
MTTPASPLPPPPKMLQVEVTGACNLRCPMCLVRYRPPLARSAASMSLERFGQLLDEIPGLTDVTLQGLGEPLLAPDIVGMVRLAASRGITVGFNTNATLLTRARAEELVDAGVGWLCISLDGAHAETYEAIRDGARFARVAANVRTLVEVVARAGRGTPDLSLVFVAMRRNLAELPAVVRLAGEWGVPTVSVQNLSHSFADAADESYVEIRGYTSREALWSEGSERGLIDAVFAEARQAATSTGVRLNLPALDERPGPRQPGTPGCDWPWRAAYVNHDGGMQPCCMVMGADRASFGNAFTDGFAPVWSGESARTFRGALLGDEPPAVCDGCSLYRGVF